MIKDKLIEDIQAEFAAEFAGVGFNFSQYLQDNIEEGLSGVKGANSVKIIGPDLAKLELAENLVCRLNCFGQVAHVEIARLARKGHDLRR